MAKYNIIELQIKNGELIDLYEKTGEEQEALRWQNAIYIYRSTYLRKVYIGQTINFIGRHEQHFNGTEERFNTADFDRVIVVFSQYFNKSALDDVEGQLITYFIADNTESARVSTEFAHNEVLNKTGGNSVNEYRERENVASKVILPLWENDLYPRGWVTTPTLNQVRTRELVKYSPIKVLTGEQSALVNEIKNNHDKNYVICGDAGTGKTVLLTHLVASIFENRPDDRIGVVVQPNWEQTGAGIFKVYGMNSSRLQVMTSTKLITAQEDYDIIIVDESHKLSRRYGKQHPSFNKVYEIEGFGDCNSHLEIIQRLGKQIILMYDVLQAIRPSHITRDMFQKLTADYERRFLTTQFRIKIPRGESYSSDDYINGIKYLLYKDTGLLESSYTNFNEDFDRGVFNDKRPDAYFGYYTSDPLHNLIEWVDRDRNFHPEHINRVLAGLVEDWKQSDGKDSTITHWCEGDIERRWNSTQVNWINSQEEDAEDQIGSVFAVQGIDLNKVGVLIGGDLQVGPDGKLVANPANFYNTNGTFTTEEMKIQENLNEFTLFVMNIYYVLLTRGIDGIRLGFWKNDEFRGYMEKTLEIDNS